MKGTLVGDPQASREGKPKKIRKRRWQGFRESFGSISGVLIGDGP